jgi:hypothetical protein
MSHELVETITDPEGNAWGPIEIGDVCIPLNDWLDGVYVQSYWSNVDGACVMPRGPINYQSAKPLTITAVSGPLAAPKMQHVYGLNANGQAIHYEWSRCGF